MFTVISAQQVKAARAMLDLSIKELADATGLSFSTICKIEAGNISPRTTTYLALRNVIESAGLELIEDDGIRKRNDFIGILKSRAACKVLCEDMLESTRKKGGEISIVLHSQETLRWFFDLAETVNFDFFEELVSVISVKCLLSEMPAQQSKALPFQYRMTLRQNISHLPAFIYADKYVILALIDRFTPPQFIVCQIPQAARNYRNDFYDLWKISQPVLALNSSRKN